MKNFLFLLLVLALGGSFMLLSDRGAPPHTALDKSTAPLSSPPPTASQALAPPFTWEDLDGQSHTLTAWRGKVVVLNFWATWCAPCVVELPAMLALAKAMGPDYQFLFLSIDQEKESIRNFLKHAHQNALPANAWMGWDPSQKIVQGLYGSLRVPETYILTPQGTIYRKIIGAEEDWTSSDVKDLLRAAQETPLP